MPVIYCRLKLQKCFYPVHFPLIVLHAHVSYECLPTYISIRYLSHWRYANMTFVLFENNRPVSITYYLYTNFYFLCSRGPEDLLCNLFHPLLCLLFYGFSFLNPAFINQEKASTMCFLMGPLSWEICSQYCIFLNMPAYLCAHFPCFIVVVVFKVSG